MSCLRSNHKFPDDCSSYDFFTHIRADYCSSYDFFTYIRADNWWTWHCKTILWVSRYLFSDYSCDCTEEVCSQCAKFNKDPLDKFMCVEDRSSWEGKKICENKSCFDDDSNCTDLGYRWFCSSRGVCEQQTANFCANSCEKGACCGLGNLRQFALHLVVLFFSWGDGDCDNDSDCFFSFKPFDPKRRLKIFRKK